MSIEVNLSFPHKFGCEALDELPGSPGLPWHFFPGNLGGGQDGILVRVLPEFAAAWGGTFAFGRHGGSSISRILSMPDPKKLCVVARGAGFVVSASNPAEWEVVRAIPIIDVRTVLAARIVVFANHTELLAYGECGVKWRTKRLAWNEFKILSIGDSLLIGEFWDMRQEAMQRFEVNLATGAARGGIET